MTTLEQKQSEALDYTNNRIGFWKRVEKSGKIEKGERLSKKDKRWLDKVKAGRPLEASMDPYLATLAQQKLRALERFRSNLLRKLGRTS